MTFHHIVSCGESVQGNFRTLRVIIDLRLSEDEDLMTRKSILKVSENIWPEQEAGIEPHPRFGQIVHSKPATSVFDQELCGSCSIDGTWQASNVGSGFLHLACCESER